MEVTVKSKVFCGMFGDTFRYFVLVFSLLCLTSISANMFTFNFSILCMSPSTNTTEPSAHPVYYYSPMEQTYLMWALGVGSLVGTFPFTYGFSKCGTRAIFTIAGLLSALATVTTPAAASLGLYPFLGVRFLQGVAYSADFAAIGMLCSRWASLKQHAFYISVLTCYSPLSSTFTFICESFLGWPFIYYMHAFLGTLLFIYWFVIYTDYPSKSPWVSSVELEKIERGKGKEQLEMNSYVPYWVRITTTNTVTLQSICTNKVVLSVWFNALCEITSSIFLITYTPVYMRYVHGYSLITTGLLSSAASFAAIPMRIAMGMVSDKIHFWSERTKMNVFNTYSVFGPALCYIAIILTPEPTVAVCLMIGIHFFYAGSGGGFYKCATLACRQYSHFVIANIQFIKCITLFCAPALYGFFVQNEADSSQWNQVFICISAAQTLASVLFVVFSTDQPQPFTSSQGSKTSKTLRKLSQVLAKSSSANAL